MPRPQHPSRAEVVATSAKNPDYGVRSNRHLGKVTSSKVAIFAEKVPYAFGLCGHGNIGFIDALYERPDEVKTISPRHETVSADAKIGSPRSVNRASETA